MEGTFCNASFGKSDELEPTRLVLLLLLTNEGDKSDCEKSLTNLEDELLSPGREDLTLAAGTAALGAALGVVVGFDMGPSEGRLPMFHQEEPHKKREIKTSKKRTTKQNLKIKTTQKSNHKKRCLRKQRVFLTRGNRQDAIRHANAFPIPLLQLVEAGDNFLAMNGLVNADLQQRVVREREEDLPIDSVLLQCGLKIHKGLS